MFPGMGNGFGQGFDMGMTPFNEPKLSKLEFPIGERILLRDFEQIGLVQRVIANRSEFLDILGANKLDGRLVNPVEEIRVAGLKLGEVDLIVIGERGIKRYKLVIRPSVTLIQGLISRQFPLSNVQVTAAGDHVLILQGQVETPHEAEAIVSLVQEFVGSRGKVLNSITLAGVMQVQLEVVIARVDRSGLRRLGINFQYAGQNGFAGNQIGGLSPVTNLAAASSNNAAAAGGTAFQNIGGAATNLVAPASTVFFGVTQELQQFMMQIEALQQQGVAKVLARPTLVSLNGRPAEFLVGGEQPFPYQANVNTSPSVDFKKFGTRLNFVPVVLGPDKIRLDLVPEVSSVNFTQAINVAGNQIPQFITQRIHTTVEMEPGQSLVLGGLLQTEYDAQVQKVPLLGDIPYVGAAFRRVRHEERETELIVIVTPRLVYPADQQAEPLPLPGEESRRPTDRELYFLGLPEAPHNGRDVKQRSEWDDFGPETVIESVPSTNPVPTQPDGTPAEVPPMPTPERVPPAVGSAGRATLQPVHAPQPSRAESSWFRWRGNAKPPATSSIKNVPNRVVSPRK
jgi:pilus assembly protein CpaC